jgi:competence ComEA-like helix-hairpin-helix protein
MRIFPKACVTAALACASLLPSIDGQEPLPAGEGKETLENMCAECHAVEKIISKTRTRQGWRKVVTSMIGRGASLTDSEASNLVEYLFEYFGEEAPGSAKVNVNKATAKEIETALELSPKDAVAIVRYRETKGNFKNWKDLTRVGGIDKSRIEAQKDRLTF